MEKLFAKYNIGAAYLFGSQINGNTHAKSDLDIAVRFDKKPTLKQTLALIGDLTSHFKFEIDLLDLDLAPLPLQFRVYQSRKLIFAKNMKYELALRNKALTLYYDYKYYHDRFTDFEIDRILTHGLT